MQLFEKEEVVGGLKDGRRNKKERKKMYSHLNESRSYLSERREKEEKVDKQG